MSTSRMSRLLMLTISIVLFAALLIGCGGTTPSVATPTPPPTAAPACLTVNTPSFTKLSDGKYVLNVDVVNCGSDESDITGTAQISAATVTASSTESSSENATLLGPTTISANGEATYQCCSGLSTPASLLGTPGLFSTPGLLDTPTDNPNPEIAFPNPPPAVATVTITITVKGETEGEWNGQVPIPA